MKNKLFIIFIFCVFSKAHAFDLFNFFTHSEIAGKNSVFIDIGFDMDIEKFEFDLVPLDICIDYVLPFPLPVSAGMFMNTPYPNLKHFGIRIAYHFDLDDGSTDFYFFYSHDFGYIRNSLLLQYNDTPVEKRLFDFRFGIRRYFGYGRSVGMRIESGYHFQSILISISIKLN